MHADATAALALVNQLFPGRPARPLHGGWVSHTFDVDGWIVQVARSTYAGVRLHHQARCVPRLAAHLPTAIPGPTLVSDDPVAVRYRKLEGAPADEAPAGPWPEQLGAALRALQAVDPAAIGLAHVSPGDLRDQRRVTLHRLRASVVPRLAPHERAAAEALIHDVLDECHWQFAPVLIHGDLGPEHVLVDPTGNLAGILDWEELGSGAPIDDFAWWIHDVPELGERMLHGFGATLDDLRRRARLTYAIGPWYEVDHGIRTCDDASIVSGLAGVRARMP